MTSAASKKNTVPVRMPRVRNSSMRVDVERVEAEHAVLGARAADDAEGGEQHRQRQRELGER